MDLEVKDMDNIMHEELINNHENEVEEFKTYGQSCTSGDEAAEEEEDDIENSNGSCNDRQQPINEINEIQFDEFKEKPELEKKSDDLKQDNQEIRGEEEVEGKDEEPDKNEAQKSSPGPENQEGSQEDNTSNLGRNRRVRQKNRYFLDFHCIDLTKGARSNKEDYDIFTSSTSTRSSNRRSTTDSKATQEEPGGYETRYCRKCSDKTLHDSTNRCQACLYKKIVESVKRQKPSSQKNRSSKQKQIESSSIRSQPQSQTNNNNNNKRKATRPQEQAALVSKIRKLRKEFYENHNQEEEINNVDNINYNPNGGETVKNITTGTTSSGIKIETEEVGLIAYDNNATSKGEIVNKLPKLDSWSPNEVADYITSKGFINEAERFKTQSVDGISLLLMQRTDFTYGLKIKLGPALKIYDQVCKLKREYFNYVANTIAASVNTNSTATN